MRRLLLLCVLSCFVVGGLAWRYGADIVSFGAGTSQRANPEDTKIRNGVFTSPYFGLSYPLPQGWTEGLAGPDPSYSGYYVLRTFVPAGKLSARMLIAAQDMFFAAKSYDDLAAAANDIRQAMSEIEGMTIEREPSAVKIADRLLQRLDFSGVGLHRAMFVAEVRCHMVTFNLTARDPEQLASLAQSLDKLSFASGRDAAASTPVCIKDYATGDNLVERVEPESVGSTAMPIPVRIIIGTEGTVKHVHAIRATAMQRRSIDEALRQWKFRPHEIDGRAVEVETGLEFRFK